MSDVVLVDSQRRLWLSNPALVRAAEMCTQNPAMFHMESPAPLLIHGVIILLMKCYTHSSVYCGF